MRVRMAFISIGSSPVGTARRSRRWVMMAAFSGYMPVTAAIPRDWAT